MAHEITTTNGIAEIILAAQDGKAWHGLGSLVHALDLAADAQGAIAQMIEALPILGCQIAKRPVLFQGAEGAPLRRMRDKFVIVRNGEHGDRRPVGVVGSQFNPWQPREILKTGAALAASIPGSRISAAGFLAEGTQMFVSLRLGDFTVADDAHAMFATLVTAFDGTKKRRIMISLVRAVCANTVAAAWQDSKETGARKEIKNTAGADAKVRDAVYDLRAQLAAMDTYKKVMQAAHDRQITKEDLGKLTLALVTGDNDHLSRKGGAEPTTRERNVAMAILDSILRAPGAQAGNLYGWFQGVTHYTSHKQSKRGARSQGAIERSPEAAGLLLENAWENKVRDQARDLVDLFLAEAPAPAGVPLSAVGF